MDFAYRHHSIDGQIESACDAGKVLYGITSSAKQSLSARERTSFVSEFITALSEELPSVSLASYASGHGRELESLTNRTRERIGEFLAIDSDALSLAELQKVMSRATCLNQNVFRTSLSGYGPFDLVYSLGLFDYLDNRSATSLLRRMWSEVRQGGSLLIANLNEDAANLGYCEAIMDWWMIQRTSSDLMQLGASLPEGQAKLDVSVEKRGCFSYLLVTKR